jgi:protein phosphatase/serine/threonine-protein phosphatase Stp1
MSHQIRYSAQTHVGLRRKLNEDAILALPEANIWVVSDGMGGHEAGDYASQLITGTIATIPPEIPPRQRMEALRTALHQAHAAILQETERRNADLIGATVASLMLADGHFAAIWAGDSRVYRLRDGEIQMLTTDHSYVATLVEQGRLTWDEAEQHPQSNQITRAVGVGEHLELDKVRGEIRRGDRFLLCSDGLSKYATFEILQQALATQPLETIVDYLIQIALRGGGADNISVIVVDVN